MIAVPFVLFIPGLMFYGLLIVLAVYVWKSNPRLGAYLTIGLASLYAMSELLPKATHDATLWLHDGYYHRPTSNGTFGVNMPENDTLEFYFDHAPYQAHNFTFVTTLTSGDRIDFKIEAINQPLRWYPNCPKVGTAYGLDRFESPCEGYNELNIVPSNRYRPPMSEPLNVILSCRNPRSYDNRKTEACRAAFVIDDYTVESRSIDEIDPARWPEVYTHIEDLLDKHFKIVSQ